MASGILLQFRRAPLHVLGNFLYSAFFVAWLVYRVLLGFSWNFLSGVPLWELKNKGKVTPESVCGQLWECQLTGMCKYRVCMGGK